MNADENVSIVHPKRNGGGYSVIVLDRIVEGFTPDYCIHGRATCMGTCGEWVYLGSETVELVKTGDVMPLCQQCASKLIPRDRPSVAHINDHRRSEGPH